MTVPPRAWVIMAVAAALALVIGANWRFFDLAQRSQPGCVAVAPDRPAAKPAC
ncbi:MAG: hypothetical protein ACK4VZ_13845 [Paracoccaceae bacterium]